VVQKVVEHVGLARAALLGCRVSELEDLKKQLLLTFTHELNTPLHEVMGCLDALMSATGSSSLPGTTWPLAHTAHASAHRAARLVRSMTDAVKVCSALGSPCPFRPMACL
jgi:signal transduction histidine kinase